MAQNTYRSSAKLRRDRAFSEFKSPSGTPLAIGPNIQQTLLAMATNNLGLSGPKGAGICLVTLTQAQIQAMNGTPVTLVPAPGAGNTIVIEGPVIMLYTFATAAYTSGGAITIQYHTGAVAAISGTLAAAQLGASNTYNVNAALPVTSSTFNPVTNDSLEITNGTGAFAGGGGTLLVQFTYQIV